MTQLTTGAPLPIHVRHPHLFYRFMQAYVDQQMQSFLDYRAMLDKESLSRALKVENDLRLIEIEIQGVHGSFCVAVPTCVKGSSNLTASVVSYFAKKPSNNGFQAVLDSSKDETELKELEATWNKLVSAIYSGTTNTIAEIMKEFSAMGVLCVVDVLSHGHGSGEGRLWVRRENLRELGLFEHKVSQEEETWVQGKLTEWTKLSKQEDTLDRRDQQKAIVEELNEKKFHVSFPIKSITNNVTESIPQVVYYNTINGGGWFIKIKDH